MKTEEDAQRWSGNGLVSCAFQGSKWDGNNMRMLTFSHQLCVGFRLSGPIEVVKLVKCNRVG